MSAEYTHENLSDRDDDISYNYDQDDSDVSEEAPALGEPQDGGSAGARGARSVGVGAGTPGFGKGKLIGRVHRNVAMQLAISNNLASCNSIQINGSLDSSAFRTLLPHTISWTSHLSTLLTDSQSCNSSMYHSLPFKDSIRLLEILPGTRNLPITARIHVTRLNAPQPYEALSYVWGREEHSHKVKVNINNVDVTPNLFHALERIRFQDCSRYIWVDQLCINQSDNDEKGNQVQLMSQIYRTARNVLVWLGKNDEDNATTPNAAFGLVCEVVNFSLKSTSAFFTSSGNIKTVPVPATLPEMDSQRWLSLQKLFDLDWFWRVWVIQEIALSVTASLMWDDSEIAWEYVGLAAAYIRINNSNLFEHCFLPGIFNAYFMYRISVAADTVFKPVSLSFLRLLTMTQQYEASDPRDRVYGLLGLPLINWGLAGKPFIQPDYNLDIQDVYRAVALGIIDAEGDLSLLSSVQHGPDFSSSQASWVPMWNTTVFTHSLLSGDDAHRHKADGGVPMDRSVVNDCNCLRVRGLDAGKVTAVLAPMKDTDFRLIESPLVYDSVWQWNNQILHTVLQASEDTALLAYTLTAGKDWYGLLVKNEKTHVADFALCGPSRLNLLISGTSLKLGAGTSTAGATTIEDKAHKAAMNARFSARTLRPQPPMLAANNGQQDFNFFPRSEQQSADYIETSEREHFKEGVDERAYSLHQGFDSSADRGDAWRFTEAAQNACNGRRLFFTEDGRLGLGPAAMREGDHLCILFGGSVPFILRPDYQSWRLIGECYVKTLMNGQSVEKYKEGMEDSMYFEIC